MAPDFDLPGTDGRRYNLGCFAGKKILIIAFTCNHCPYVQAYEDRLMALQRDYAAKGVQVVAINANETRNYPEDSLDKMVIRAKERRFNFPYLRDEDQSVARAYDAACTPEFYAFDRGGALRYHGRFDDNYQDATAVRSHDLRNAVDDLLAGREVKRPTTPALGCSIKWM